jgi:hypothetical protein
MIYILTWVAPRAAMGSINAPKEGTMFEVERFESLEELEEYLKAVLNKDQYRIIPAYKVK